MSDEPLECNGGCPACCGDIEELNARAEAALRNRALSLSNWIVTLMIGSHIWFSYLGKSLDVPDIVWAIVMAPWGGVAVGKIAALMKRK